MEKLPQEKEYVRTNWKLKSGIVLMILSAPVFISLLLVPFLNIENKNKLTLTTIIIITGEVLFWSGGLLVGKELFTRYKSFLDPRTWFKKNRKNGTKQTNKL